MHGQIASAQALLAGFPTGLVVLRADGLQHRNVAAKRPQAGTLRTGHGKARGIDQDLGAHFVQPVFDLFQAGAFLEAGNGDRQRIEAGRLQALAKHVDERGIGCLQVRTVEQYRRYRVLQLPLGVPVLERGIGSARVIQRGAWQRLRCIPVVIAAQPLAGQVLEQVDSVGLAALTQVVPKALGWLPSDGAKPGQFRIGAVVTGHQDQLHAA
ncbi:hypothetical protein D3C81_1583890 [compost metagenome]